MSISQSTAVGCQKAPEIFPGGQIDGCLAADGGIHRSQHSSRHLDVGNSPQIGGGSKACQIANHTTAQGNNAIAAG